MCSTQTASLRHRREAVVGAGAGVAAMFPRVLSLSALRPGWRESRCGEDLIRRVC
jgi:hypothetical protein